MSIYDSLNEKQIEAVLHDRGPLLILAGAGSGKTRVLTHRIAYLIEERDVSPFQILAITFTNKAAREMRERVDKIVGYGAENIWVSTFHSTCVRILRRFIETIGYNRNFTIYDPDDQKTLMREVCKYLDIDTKQIKERTFLTAISHAKDELITPEEYELNAANDYNKKKYAAVYKEYQKRLKANNALDFDDLIMKTVELFQNNPDVLAYYQRRFRYIMVDEYQDTNTAQFRLISLLASYPGEDGTEHNLCVVGDDDQSIYKFRGANIYNILNFEKVYPDARVIKLEQNYRSTGNILAAANEVIHNNRGRKDKTLWTNNVEGSPVHFTQYETDYNEAEGVASHIQSQILQNSTLSYKDFAILYRTNAQSRALEEKLILKGIPYRVIGSINFYQRKEIKDMLAYLKTIDNAPDNVAVKRIINVPKRGIGLTSIDRIDKYAEKNGLSFYEALRHAEFIDGLGRASAKLSSFVALIESLRSKLSNPEYSLKDLIEEILTATGYIEELKQEGDEEAAERIANIDELINKAVLYEKKEDEPSLSGFLEEVALVADIDNLEESNNVVVLMTLHSAKGLEFPYVYLCGMEEGLFPSYMSLNADNPELEIEEERRLCYVGITRAMQQLYLSACRTRMLRGENQFNAPSRFLREIPRYLLAYETTEKKTTYQTSNAFPKSPVRNAAPSNASSSIVKTYSTKASASHIPSYTSTPAKNFGGSGLGTLQYSIGDTVSHMKFGKGTVTNIVSGGKDYEVTVQFEAHGSKKMLASFANLKKVE